MRVEHGTIRTFLLTTLLGVAATAAPALAKQPIGNSPLRLEVDLSERRLYVHHGGSVVETFEIAVGQPGHRTPTGEFTIDRIIWNPRWVPPESDWAKGETRKQPGDPDNPMQGAKLFFRYPAYYIHGTNAPASLGEAASHGCIRMHVSDVIDLYRRVPVGTPVLIR